MQMLQQVFGVDGARYVVWLLTGAALLLVALFVWWLIRKALGDRINMSDRADRRGRPPRLGVTETFAIGPQGRRLVMVRRDNVEHLIMIGGPNDVVIETNVVRGERPVVGRSDPRAADAELTPLPDPLPAVKAAPEPKAVMPTLRAPEPMPAPVARKPVEPPPVRAPEPSPAPLKLKPVEPPPAPPPVRAPEPTPAPAAGKPVEPPPAKTTEPVAAAVASAAPPPAAPASPPPLSFVERIKSGFGRNAVAPKPEAPKAAESAPEPMKAEAQKAEPPKQAEPPKTPEPTRVDPPKPAPRAEPPPVPSPAEMKAKLEEAVKAKLEAMPTPAAAPSSPPAPPPAAPAPPAAARPPAEAQPAAKSASAAPARNPFDSLEEEMAKLLGRTPDGKG